MQCLIGSIFVKFILTNFTSFNKVAKKNILIKCSAAVQNDIHTLRDYPNAMSNWKYFCQVYPNEFYMQDCPM
jgi:hypothetical protein